MYHGKFSNFTRNSGKAGYTLIAKYAKTIAKCEKQKVYSEVFCVTFFAFCASFFAFGISQLGQHSCKNSKGFRGLLLRGINKTRNSHEMRKVLVSVSYSMACFAKTFVKYSQNTKYKECIAGLQVFISLTFS